MNKSNILATIADLKAELRQINEQKQHLESSINSLYKLIGKKGQTLDVVSQKITSQQSPQTGKGIDATTPSEKGLDAIVPSYRVRLVLNNMNGRFLRSDLYRNSSNDGRGPIAPGTFANIFSKLVKRRLIVCVDGEAGQRNAVFVKASEYNNLIDSTSQNSSESRSLELK